MPLHESYVYCVGKMQSVVYEEQYCDIAIGTMLSVAVTTWCILLQMFHIAGFVLQSKSAGFDMIRKLVGMRPHLIVAGWKWAG